jgi:hypothetical protein
MDLLGSRCTARLSWRKMTSACFKSFMEIMVCHYGKAGKRDLNLCRMRKTVEDSGVVQEQRG